MAEFDPAEGLPDDLAPFVAGEASDLPGPAETDTRPGDAGGTTQLTDAQVEAVFAATTSGVGGRPLGARQRYRGRGRDLPLFRCRTAGAHAVATRSCRSWRRIRVGARRRRLRMMLF